MVYLDVEPASCQHRVRNMRQTESEQLIPLDYFHGIDDMYFDLLMKVNTISNRYCSSLLLACVLVSFVSVASGIILGY